MYDVNRNESNETDEKGVVHSSVVLSKQGFSNNRIKRTTIKQQQNNEKYFFLLF